MKEQVKYHNAMDKIDLRDEKAIKEALQREGVYSKSHIFPISSLQFELTSHCNVICKHCYNNSGANNNMPDAMSPENWVSFSRYLVEHGGVFECILSGGEPLLLGDTLFEIMDILHDDGTLFLLITNGYFLTEEKAKRLKKYRYHWLQVSIDGVTPEYHDSFRQRQGSWKRAVSGALSVSQNGIPLKIAHCITPYNIQDIDKMCDFAYSLGASSITIGELCLSGRAGKNQDLLLSIEQRKILFQKVKENASRYQGRMRVKSSNSVKMGLERHLDLPSSGAVIRPNGDIRIDGMAPFVIGNILKEDFTEIWAKKIDVCWKDPRVTEYISSFDADDRNHSFINYIDDDIYI